MVGDNYFVFTVKELLEGLYNHICQTVPLYFLCLPLWVKTSFTTLGAEKCLPVFYYGSFWHYFLHLTLAFMLVYGVSYKDLTMFSEWFRLITVNSSERWLVISSTAVWGVCDGNRDSSGLGAGEQGYVLSQPPAWKWEERHWLECGSSRVLECPQHCPV